MEWQLVTQRLRHSQLKMFTYVSLHVYHLLLAQTLLVVPFLPPWNDMPCVTALIWQPKSCSTTACAFALCTATAHHRYQMLLITTCKPISLHIASPST